MNKFSKVKKFTLIALMTVFPCLLMAFKTPVVSADTTEIWTKEPGIRLQVEGTYNFPYLSVMPDVIELLQLPDGTYRMYYVQPVDGISCANILSAISSDGLTWTKEDGARISYGGDIPWAFAPNIITLPDGTYRMYYSVIIPGGHYIILSATSTDGLSWAKEPGIRINYDDIYTYVGAADVIKLPDGTYRMYYQAWNANGSYYDILSAVSNDGLAWAKEEGVRIGLGGRFPGDDAHVPKVIILPDGTYRMYYSVYSDRAFAHTYIVSAISSDGLNWTRETGIRINYGGIYDTQAIFPGGIIKLSNNTYRMYYQGFDGTHYNFLSAITNQPPTIQTIDQYKSDGQTKIGEGKTTTENTITFKATIIDPDNDQVKLQVELRQKDEPFTGIDDGGILTSDLVDSGSEAIKARPALSDGQYHWRYRAIDDKGNQSNWQEFKTMGDVDFVVDYVKDIDIAIILAEPNDVPHNTEKKDYKPCKLLPKKEYQGFNKNYYEDLAFCVKDYYLENSYGTVNLNFTILDNNGNWYQIDTASQIYGNWYQLSQQGNTNINEYKFGESFFAKEAFFTVRDSGLDLSKYAMIGIVHPALRADTDNFYEGKWHPDNRAWPPGYAFLGEPPYKFLVSGYSFTGSWAHEIGHTLGLTIDANYLCDLHGQAGYDCDYRDGEGGKGWDLMADGSLLGVLPCPPYVCEDVNQGYNPSHLSSFSRERLDWLEFEENDIIYGRHTIESLETSKIHQKTIKKFTVSPNYYYLFEGRTTNPQYSQWDTAEKESGKDNALLVYSYDSAGAVDILNLEEALSDTDKQFTDASTEFSTTFLKAIPEEKSLKFDFELVRPDPSPNINGAILQPQKTLLKQSLTADFFAENFPLEPITVHTEHCQITTPRCAFVDGYLVKVVIKNNSDKTVWVNEELENRYPAIQVKKPDGSWEYLYKDVLLRPLPEDAPFPGGTYNAFLKLNKTQLQSYDLGRVGDDIIQSGTYRMAFGYSFEEKRSSYSNRSELQIAYSNEFEVIVSHAPVPTLSIAPLIIPTPITPQFPYNLQELTKECFEKFWPLFLLFLLIISVILVTRKLKIPLLSKQKRILVLIVVVLLMALLLIMIAIKLLDRKVERLPRGQNSSEEPSVVFMTSAENQLMSQNNNQKSKPSIFFPFQEVIPGVKPLNLDIDLHAITLDGKHTGMNYQTGEYENQIPNTLASGDLTYGREWIFVPQSTEVRFYVSSQDIQQTLNENPYLMQQLPFLQETYNISAIYYDEASQRYESNIITEQIEPGVNQGHLVIGTHEETTITPADKIPPTTTISLSDNLGNNNWFTSNVQISLLAQDNENGVGVQKIEYSLDNGQTWITYAEPFTISNEGITKVLYHSQDYVDNLEETKEQEIKIDKTKPEITISEISPEYIYKDALVIEFSAIDSVSGVESIAATLNNQSIQSGQTIVLNQLGTNILKIIAEDKAGNIKEQTKEFKVVYQFSGFLPPLQEGKTYNLGRDIPIKFQLKDFQGNYISTVQPKIYLAKIINNQVQSEIPAVPSGNSNQDNIARYDTKENQYIYNLSTKNLSQGFWQIRVDLNDESKRTTIVNLK